MLAKVGLCYAVDSTVNLTNAQFNDCPYKNLFFYSAHEKKKRIKWIEINALEHCIFRLEVPFIVGMTALS